MSPSTAPNAAGLKAKEHGHYIFRVRPEPYQSLRFADREAAKQFLKSNTVRAQGWEFPPASEKLKSALDYVYDDIEFENFVEHFRLYLSGQYVHVSGFYEDWRYENGRGRLASDSTGSELAIVLSLGEITMFFRFAARLATHLEAGTFRVTVEMHGLRDRRLVVNNLFGTLRGDPRATQDIWKHEREYSRPDLIGNADSLALDAFMDLLGFCNYGIAERSSWKSRQEGQMSR